MVKQSKSQKPKTAQKIGKIDWEKYTIPEDELEACQGMLERFKLDGKPANEVVTEGQLKIFHAIVFKPSKRVEILTSTQYGKSRIVSMACVVLTCLDNQMVAVVAPTNEKAKYIMRYYVEHLGDDPVFEAQLEADTKLERLRQEENKERIILRDGGGLFVISVQAGNTKKRVEAAMGAGAKNVILDEGCLTPDDAEATIFRMISGQGEDAFYCKIGNPFYAEPPYSHFFTTWQNPDYYKIFIDYNQALKEGRYNEAFINEARSKPLFDVLFECKFPRVGIADERGWMPLLTRREVELAMDGAESMDMFGEKAIGMDPADLGDNESVAIVRGANLARIEFANNKTDPVNFGGQGLLIIKAQKIQSNNVYVDPIGVGAGTVAAIREQGQPVNAVNVAEKALDAVNFENKKAENYWRLRSWVQSGGKLFPDERWYQLTNVKYRAAERTGRMQIMSKEEMRRRQIPSPDCAEALMLTFTDKIKVFAPSYEDKFFREKMRKQKEMLRRQLHGKR